MFLPHLVLARPTDIQKIFYSTASITITSRKYTLLTQSWYQPTVKSSIYTTSDYPKITLAQIQLPWTKKKLKACSGERDRQQRHRSCQCIWHSIRPSIFRHVLSIFRYFKYLSPVPPPPCFPASPSLFPARPAGIHRSIDSWIHGFMLGKRFTS